MIMHLTIEIILSLAAVSGWFLFLIHRSLARQQLQRAIKATTENVLKQYHEQTKPKSPLALYAAAGILFLLAAVLLRRKSPAPPTP